MQQGWRGTGRGRADPRSSPALLPPEPAGGAVGAAAPHRVRPSGPGPRLHRWVLERVLKPGRLVGVALHKTVQGLASHWKESTGSAPPAEAPPHSPDLRLLSEARAGSPLPRQRLPTPSLLVLLVCLPGPWPLRPPSCHGPQPTGRLLPPCLFPAVGVRFARAEPHPSTSSASESTAPHTHLVLRIIEAGSAAPSSEVQEGCTLPGSGRPRI